MSGKTMRQQNLFEAEIPEKQYSGPVTCLGMTFENDDARRTHFTEALRNKLQDPESVSYTHLTLPTIDSV